MHELKILEQDDNVAIIGGYGVVFGGADLEGETFTADTDYMLDLAPVKPVYIDHSQETEFTTSDGKRVKLTSIDEPVGRVIEVTPDDVGLYMRMQIDKAGRYWGVVDAMIGTGKAGLSSGTIGHLARRDGKTITRWPLVEESITLTPAEPRTVDGVERLKHLAELNPDLKAIFTEADSASAVGDATGVGGKATIQIMENNDMEEMNEAQADPRDEQIKSLSDRVNQMIELMEKSPALKSAGYTTDDGGAADPTHKSLGDWLLAVKRNDTKRLTTVYGSKKDMAEGAGATGGYLVPTEHLTPLLRLAEMQSPIYQRVTKQPVAADAGEWPALDQFVAPSAGAGNTAFAGGVTAAATAEGATLTETQPTFVNLEYRIHKIGGYVEVSNEMIADSPESIEGLLRSLFGLSIAAKNERNILRGTGVGEPLGILNAPGTIGVTTNANDTFSYTDVLNMMSRFRAAGGAPVWITHPSVIPQIGTLAVASGSPVVWAGNLAGGQPNTLMGYPILFSEHMPQWKSDDVILADLSAYIMFERSSLSVAYSEHAAFLNDKGTWRFTVRNDGMPWVKSAITLADPTGSYTVSPFVYHND